MSLMGKYPILILGQSSYGNSFLRSHRPSLPSSSQDGVTLGNSSPLEEASMPIPRVFEHCLPYPMKSSPPATYQVLGRSPTTA